MKKNKEFEFIQMPFVKNVSARTIAQDIVPYIPGDEKNMKMWDSVFRDMYNKIKKDFDEKGIPMPTISIDSTPGPITYGIKTEDANGNVIHTLLK